MIIQNTDHFGVSVAPPEPGSMPASAFPRRTLGTNEFWTAVASDARHRFGLTLATIVICLDPSRYTAGTGHRDVQSITICWRLMWWSMNTNFIFPFNIGNKIRCNRLICPISLRGSTYRYGGSNFYGISRAFLPK